MPPRRIDLKNDRKDLYQPASTDFSEVVVPPMTYLAIDGHGDPNGSPGYAVAVGALYAAAYSVRAVHKAGAEEDFVVGPLEGLWSSSATDAFTGGRKDEWDWTMLIPLPEEVTPGEIEQGLARAATKRADLPVAQVGVLRIDEGRALQILHLGSYDDEAPTLARLHGEVMPARGLTWNGRHHEIYLSDPNRTAPEKLRTVLRQPVAPIG